MLVKSGIDCLDERLTGLVQGRAHVLTGSPGSGKTVACLEFLNRGLDDGERCAMLSMDDPADLLAQCEFLGRWVVYQSDCFPPFTLLIAPVAGGESRRLLLENAGSATDIAPMWSSAAP